MQMSRTGRCVHWPELSSCYVETDDVLVVETLETTLKTVKTSVVELSKLSGSKPLRAGWMEFLHVLIKCHGKYSPSRDRLIF
jgi:hypothetical protein